jgi:hypothetical protein
MEHCCGRNQGCTLPLTVGGSDGGTEIEEPPAPFRPRFGQSVENVDLKRIITDISCFFYWMSHFGANELFSVEPFVMLGIDGGWPEKFVRIRLLNWE